MHLKARPVPSYERPIRQALGWQVVLFVLGVLSIDMGESTAYFMIVSFVFWIAVATICARRPGCPANSDLAFIKLGLPIMGLLFPIVFMVVDVLHDILLRHA